MAVQKVSKVAKKNSKLDSLKNLVLGGSGAASKKTGSQQKQPSAASSPASSQTAKKAAAASAATTKGTPPSSESKPLTKPKAPTKARASGSSTGKKNGAGIRSLDLGETVCREVACEGLSTSGGYCRLHYIKNWKKIKRKEMILREKKLNQYIEELVAKYPDKYIEAIRQDLANDKDFAKVIYDLDLDEGVDDFDVEGGESVDSLIDTIKRDFDDEGDGF